MGLVAPLAELFFYENKYRSIGGDILFIGRQDIFLTADALFYLKMKYGVSEQPRFFIEHSPSRKKLITDRSFMSSFDIRSLTFLDVSDYEGADIIWDLGQPIESDLYNRFDLIFNGSCLDNMFNPSQAMINISRMLKPNGRVIHLEHASSYNNPYLMYSPGWLFDYYVQNGFADCKIYVGQFGNSNQLFFGPWSLMSHDWELNPLGDIPASGEGRHYMLVAIAEKKSDSTYDHQPIQSQYRRDPKALDEYENNVRYMKKASRPVFGWSKRRLTPDRKMYFLGILGLDVYRNNYPPLD